MRNRLGSLRLCRGTMVQSQGWRGDSSTPGLLPAFGEVPVSCFPGAGGLLWVLRVGGEWAGATAGRLLRAWPASSSPQAALWDRLTLSHRVRELEPKSASRDACSGPGDGERPGTAGLPAL